MKTEIPKTKLSRTLVNKARVPNPAKLPKLTPELLNYQRQGVMLKKEKCFINLWANDLLSITNDRPTQTDYANYASTIVNTYPQFAGGVGGCVSNFT